MHLSKRASRTHDKGARDARSSAAILPRNLIRGTGVMALTLGVAAGAGAITTDPGELALVDALVGPAGEHCDAAIAGGDYETIFICGDEFFEFRFNAVDGGGMNVGDGGRYTRDAPGERHPLCLSGVGRGDLDRDGNRRREAD